MDRLIFLTDGVYAIAITLLAIELILPEATSRLRGDELVDALWDRRYEALAYLTSFAFIGNFWFGQLMLLRHVRRFDGRLAWLVLLQLLFVAFVPFTSSVIGRHPAEQVAQLLYFGTMTLTSWALAGLWAYAVGRRRLVGADVTARMIKAGHRSTLGVSLVFTLLTLLVAVGAIQQLPVLLIVCLIALGGVLMCVVVGDPIESAARDTDGF